MNLIKISDLEKIARIHFQKWIRKRDKDQPCISCGTKDSRIWHGSHYYAAGVYSGYIFEPMNCHKSCEQCNTFLHGNLINYRIGLIERYGEAYVEQLEHHANAKKNRKYTKDELIEIANKYKTLLKQNP